MTETTALDRAHAALEASPDDDRLRLAFYGELLSGSLFILLDREAGGDEVEPRLFPLDEGPYVLVFDTEERLAEFAAGPVPYAEMPGRQVALRLRGHGIGLAINLGTAPSQMLLPPEAVTWLAEQAAVTPEDASIRIRQIAPPKEAGEALLRALDRALARTVGLADAAFLCRATYEDDEDGLLLAFLGADPAAEAVLAQCVQGAITFSGGAPMTIDVVFLSQDAAEVARLEACGLRFDLSTPAQEGVKPPTSNAPPRLR